jgi:hypothetical protein
MAGGVWGGGEGSRTTSTGSASGRAWEQCLDIGHEQAGIW